MVSSDCLFCKIAAKEIPAKLVYEDADVFAFDDINPQAPTHILLCPRKHLGSLAEATNSEQALLGKIQLIAAQIALDRKLSAGYRTVINTGAEAGQSVFHLHAHLLGGRPFHWPPG
jgi:histidine triad (HIT) family protein